MKHATRPGPTGRRAVPGKRAFYAWVGLVGLVVSAASGHFFYDLRCLLAIPAVDPAPGRTRFLSCTNLPQRFEVDGGQSLPAEEPGWMVLTPTNETATVRVILPKMTDKVVFYPRVGGPSGRVAVYEPVGAFRKELFRLSHPDDGWTGIGVQYGVCLGCVENGWSDEEFPVTLEIVLQGKGAQLWHKDNILFFEAP